MNTWNGGWYHIMQYVAMCCNFSTRASAEQLFDKFAPDANPHTSQVDGYVYPSGNLPQFVPLTASLFKSV
ncbi:unnamed protein product [Diplocarpon coronariae]